MCPAMLDKNGVVIGALDSLPFDLKEFKFMRRLAYDDANSLVDENGKPVVDSAAAHRILTACMSALDPSDFDKLVTLMRDADMIGKTEAAAISAAAEGTSGEPAMASDAVIKAQRHILYEAGRITRTERDAPIRRPMTAAEDRQLKEMYPDFDRLSR